MRNQISGSISLDVSALAEDITRSVLEHLNPSGVPAATPVGRGEAALLLAAATGAKGGHENYPLASAVIEHLSLAGYVLFRQHPQADGTPSPKTSDDIRSESWFNRTD